MRSAFRTETLRSITHSLGRFLAIAAIVALGTGFYAGLRMTAPDMKLAADEFYDGTALMDIRVVSTLGLTDGDLAALRQVEGVEAVMGAYETDVMATIAGEQYATRVHSLPDAARDSDTSDGVHALSQDAGYLNRPILVEGSWPENEGECVLSADLVVNGSTSIGDAVVITEGVGDVDETLATRTYTVVGYVSSSYYATSSSMGTTTLGTGAIQEYLYVPESDFDDDLPYTEAFIAVRGAAGEHASSDAYDQRVAEVVDRIQAIAPEREQARVDGLKADAQKELDDGRAEYERQKADAQAQLDEAERRLDEAAATIARSEQDLADGQASYERGVSELAGQREAAEARLADGARQLEEGQAQLDAGRAALDEAAALLEAAWAQAGLTYDQAEGLSGQLSQQIALDREALAALQAQLEGLDPASQEYQTIAEQAALLQGKVQAENDQLDKLQDLIQNQDELQAQTAELDDAAAQLDRSRADLSAARQQADSQLAAAQRQLDEAAAQLVSGREQLAQGRADYEEGLAEYERQRADADAKLADAQRELDDAQRQIDDLEAPDWLVMDRTANYGVASFEADADRVDSIAQVFPFIFFLVAALVALTTMTRMVEEERVLIGTFKALGYRRFRIVSKYLVYAAVASGAGSFVGIAVLSQVLPAVIMKAYAIIYFVPSMPLPLPVDWALAALALGLGMGVTLFATWAAAWATLRERPATLMLPRAPKAGRRILLERAAPLWRRLSFSWKVTFRNLFRYKKRLVMTVIGIAGCTALLLTGLGLSDAINDIIDKQFGEIVEYNATITLEDDIAGDDEAGSDGRRAIEAVLDDGDVVAAHTMALQERLLASGPDASDTGIELVVPQDPSSFGEFFALRTRIGHDPVELSDDGLLVSEKLARELGLETGDAITLTEQDAIGNPTSTSYEATVDGIVENYIYHYVFMGPGLYERLTGEAPAYDAVLADVTATGEERVRFGEELRAVDGVKTVAYNDETIDAYRDMLSSVNMIVVVLVVAAAALAFIVLCNLTNINITERMREIATLKVLGFTPREMNAYIFRETFLLAAIGCAAGLALGIWMESFVVVTAEVNQVMFGREIHAASFAVAFALTMLFTVVVMLAMRGKLARIDMVESLKSNE